MGDRTGITWTDHTCNPWFGCAPISAGCANCYAREQTPVRVARLGGTETWGHGAVRIETKGWLTSLEKWQRAAVRTGKRSRVFVASLADVFEMHPDVQDVQRRLWPALEAAHGLDIQLVTKRPENVRHVAPTSWIHSKHGWPRHVQLGVTVENQEAADKRIPELLSLPARVKFLSVEPLLGPIKLRCPAVGAWPESVPTCPIANAAEWDDWKYWCARGAGIKWLIVGGESGARARPCELDWIRSLVSQCREVGTPVFVKQLGARAGLRDAAGADPAEWPEDLRVQEFPEVSHGV